MDTPAPHAAVVAPATDAERAGLALLAARAMHDNPMHVAAIGPDVDRRVEVMRRAYVPMLAGREVLAARVGERVVGVAAHTPSPGCRTGIIGLVRFAPAAVRAGAATPRLLRWLADWGRRDPGEPHSHLGPVAVDARFRGSGVGGALLARYAALLDERGQTGYLETDRPANVRFYRRFGFEVTDEALVLGVPNWFMVRAPR